MVIQNTTDNEYDTLKIEVKLFKKLNLYNLIQN